VQARYRDVDATIDRVPHLAHRLDQDTSGLLLVLWDRKLTARVQQQFETREVTKQYLAIVHGSPAQDSGVGAFAK
jgi:23S rRNA-/tRNA-specific pseudouridylate synthase